MNWYCFSLKSDYWQECTAWPNTTIHFCHAIESTDTWNVWRNLSMLLILLSSVALKMLWEAVGTDTLIKHCEICCHWTKKFVNKTIVPHLVFVVITTGKFSAMPNMERENKHLYQSILLHLTELVSSGERTGRHPPHLGQLQHRQQQPVYPLLTEVDGLEIQTHLCLCTYISSLSKSLFIFLPRSHLVIVYLILALAELNLACLHRIAGGCATRSKCCINLWLLQSVCKPASQTCWNFHTVSTTSQYIFSEAHQLIGCVHYWGVLGFL